MRCGKYCHTPTYPNFVLEIYQDPVTNHSENTGKSSEIRILINIGEHFIDENNIRSVSRFGKGTKIFLTNGQELVVSASYEKVVEVIAKHTK